MIYLGTFSFDYVRGEEQEDWFGSFQIVVECDSPEHAEKKFKSIIKKEQNTGDSFKEIRDIYFDVFHELKKVPKKGTIINYHHSRGKKPSVIARPTADKSLGVKGFEWYPEGTQPPSWQSGEQYTCYPFISFETW